MDQKIDARKAHHEHLKAIRRERLRLAIDHHAGGSQALFAQQTDTNKSHLSQLLTGVRAIGDQFARKLEVVLHEKEGWMDDEDALLAEMQEVRAMMRAMSPADREAWMKHGRLLVQDPDGNGDSGTRRTEVSQQPAPENARKKPGARKPHR